jgi:hypothetical protein
MDPLEQFLYDTGIAMRGEVKRVAQKIRESDWLRAVEAAVRADQIEKDAEIAWNFHKVDDPEWGLVSDSWEGWLPGEVPEAVAAAIRAQLPERSTDE